MTRKIKDLEVTETGRDQGKHFVLTEMSAMKAEKWAAKALLALLKSGVDIPDDAAKSGLVGVASLGMNAFSGLSWEAIEPLMDEMLTCVQYVDPNTHMPRKILANADDIEEITTMFTIRKELLELHTGRNYGRDRIS